MLEKLIIKLEINMNLPNPSKAFVDAMLARLKEDIGDAPVIISTGRRSYLETIVQMLQAQYPTYTPLAMYYHLCEAKKGELLVQELDRTFVNITRDSLQAITKGVVQ